MDNNNIYIAGKINLTKVIDMDIAITRMSSKGQIVIPQEMRGAFKEGDKIVVMQNGDHIIMKKADKFSKQLEEDLIFAKRTETAWKKYEQGKFKTMEFDDFVKEVKKW
jgi:AbrB family looped-hinge helix DNA binding protein